MNLSSVRLCCQTFGDKACHPEHMRFAQCKLREGSGSTGGEIPRFAQDDSQDTSPVRLREALSPNISCVVQAAEERVTIEGIVQQ